SPTERDDESFVRISATTFSRNRAGQEILSISDSPLVATRSGFGGALYLGDDYGDTTKNGKLRCRLSDDVNFSENNSENGGALTSVSVSELSLESVVFSRNFGVRGGALYMQALGDKSPITSRPPAHYLTGRNITYSDNVGALGGAMFLLVSPATAPLQRKGLSPFDISARDERRPGQTNNDDDVFFEDSSFKGNTAVDCGGGVYTKRGRLGCRSCTFAKNKVAGRLRGSGGALCIVAQSTLHGRDVRFVKNGAAHGGAVYAEDSLVDMVGGVVEGNRAALRGGGVYVNITFGTLFEHNISARLWNTSFVRNKARIGGGAYLFIGRGLAALDVENCTSSDSTAPTVHSAVSYLAACGVDPQQQRALFRSTFMSFKAAQFVDNNATQTGGALFTNAPEEIDVCCGCGGNLSHADVGRTTAGLDSNNPCPETWLRNVAGKVDGGNVLATAAT
ncbi:unnamed protein product, partial [Ostreobium quekettii]